MFGGELFLAGGRQAIVFRALVAFGLPPLGGEPPLPFEPMQGRVEGTGFHLQYIAGADADAPE